MHRHRIFMMIACFLVALSAQAAQQPVSPLVLENAKYVSLWAPDQSLKKWANGKRTVYKYTGVLLTFSLTKGTTNSPALEQLSVLHSIPVKGNVHSYSVYVPGEMKPMAVITSSEENTILRLRNTSRKVDFLTSVPDYGANPVFGASPSFGRY